MQRGVNGGWLSVACAAAVNSTALARLFLRCSCLQGAHSCKGAGKGQLKLYSCTSASLAAAVSRNQLTAKHGRREGGCRRRARRPARLLRMMMNE
jgi:hypothetical protein